MSSSYCRTCYALTAKIIIVTEQTQQNAQKKFKLFVEITQDYCYKNMRI